MIAIAMREWLDFSKRRRKSRGQKWWRKKKNTMRMAWGEDAGTERKEGTMCVHAAHVACQPAWQPGGLPSVSSSSLASKSEAPPSLSLSLSLSSSLSIYLFLFLFLPLCLSPFFLSFWGRAMLQERKGIFLFIKL